MNKVELHQALTWDCEECGAANYCRVVTADLPDDEREEMYRKFTGLEDYESLPEDWRDFVLTTSPDRVKCCECGVEFETVDQRDTGPEMR